MSDTLTSRTDLPDYPMARAAGCPLAPAPVALELIAAKQLSRVRIWDGSTPWLITGYDAIRALFTDARASVDDRKPGYPHWNEGMLAAELKSFGLKAFLLPLNPGNGDDGNMVDHACSAMNPVWDAIEESGRPVTHHIGETPPKAPCEVNNVAVAMMVNIDGFREMFSNYIFGGILDRHPGLRIGWFEGGIAWVPPALRDAEHVLASYQHMLDHSLARDIRYYWDMHMSVSFMVDPLGLSLIDRLGADTVMWSSDYPHNESTFGYSEKSSAAAVDAVGADNAARIVSGNIKKSLGV